jgi:hypothetical protein
MSGLLAELLVEEGVQAVFLTGSEVRGERDVWSDLDLSVLVTEDRLARNTVTYREGRLVSVERCTVRRREQAFTEPETALWNLTSLQTGLALHDPDAVFAALQARARAFDWAELEPVAQARAAVLVTDAAEEIHKVMGGLHAGDAGKVLYAAAGLTFSLGTAALLSCGTLISTENRYLTLAQGAWDDAAWHAAYGVLTGLTGAAVPERGRAALHAYLRAVALTRWPAGPPPLARETAARVRAFLAG